MSTGIFDKKEHQSIDEMVKQALNLNFVLWHDIMGYLKEHYDAIESE